PRRATRQRAVAGRPRQCRIASRWHGAGRDGPSEPLLRWIASLGALCHAIREDGGAARERNVGLLGPGHGVRMRGHRSLLLPAGVSVDALGKCLGRLSWSIVLGTCLTRGGERVKHLARQRQKRGGLE